MNIGIITVRDENYHPNRRLIEAASSQGHQASLVHPYRVWPGIESGEPGLIGHLETAIPNAVLPRQGATIGESCLALISHFSRMGIPVINDLDAIRLTRNQFLTLQALTSARIPVPDTMFVNDVAGFDEALKKLGDPQVVIKQVSSRQGEGVLLINNEPDAQSAARSRLDKKQGLLVQRFIPPHERRDIRVLIVGGAIVGAMELQPVEGDFRANYHLSGQSRSVVLSAEIENIALKAAATVGLEIAGVDLIVDQSQRVSVIEINYSPGFRGMEAATELDIAGQIVEYVASTYS